MFGDEILRNGKLIANIKFLWLTIGRTNLSLKEQHKNVEPEMDNMSKADWQTQSLIIYNLAIEDLLKLWFTEAIRTILWINEEMYFSPFEKSFSWIIKLQLNFLICVTNSCECVRVNQPHVPTTCYRFREDNSGCIHSLEQSLQVNPASYLPYQHRRHSLWSQLLMYTEEVYLNHMLLSGMKVNTWLIVGCLIPCNVLLVFAKKSQ